MESPDLSCLSQRRPGQLEIRLTLVFAPPRQADPAQLDRWLSEVLGIGPEDLASVRDGEREAAAAPASEWLRRCLLLARELWQAGRIPVFALPRLLSCAPQPEGGEKWRAVVAVALVENISRSIYEVAINASFKLALWAATHAVNDDNRRLFFRTITDQTLPTLANRQVAGKSTMPLLRGAYARGIPITHLAGGVFQLGWGGKARRLERSTSQLDSAMGARLAQNKVFACQLLRLAGLPAPVHEIAGNQEEAQAAARRLGWPLVAKPADRDRGEGVTVDVNSESRLKSAFAVAAQASRTKQVIVERQVEGICVRLFVIAGKMLYAVKRLPMGVRGDGRSSIARLVALEVAKQQRLPPWRRSEIRPLDESARAAIKAAGYSETSVVPAGVLVPLRRIESTAEGGINEEVTSRVHPENLRIALAAAELFGLYVAGIDIITPDIARPWFENGAIINEVNYAPLFAGRDVSLEQLPTFLENFVDGDGRVPVELFVGGDAAWDAARKRWQTLVDDGLGACLTSAVRTLDPTGADWPMPWKSLYRRVRALVLAPRTEVMILVVQTDELLDRGLPLEAVDRVIMVDDRLDSFHSPGVTMAPDRLVAVQALLAEWGQDGH